MNQGDFYTPSFYQRNERQVKEVIVMTAVLLFGVIYAAISPFQRIVDKVVNPAVSGITMAYGEFSSAVYRFTNIDLGFVHIPPDQSFLLSVRLATYINERRAGPIIDIAGDPRYADEDRSRALTAILKFESINDWIQPFLNELPKGGLLGLYQDDAHELNELVKRIRAEGGVRQPLVRAYAEVIFSFMLQVPDLVIRRHACQWVSDVVAEDALFLLIPRFAKEKDPKVQREVEQALLNIRAVSEPETAKDLILPYYRKPPWPSLRLPLAVVMARLGQSSAVELIRKALQSEDLSREDRIVLSVAAAQTPYPRELKMADKDKQILAERQRLRQEQQEAAVAKHEKIRREEYEKQLALIRAEAKRLKAEALAEEAAQKEETQKAASEQKEQEIEAAKAEKEEAARKAKEADDAKAKAAAQKVAMVPPPVQKQAPKVQKAAPPVEKAAPKAFPVPGAESAAPEVKEATRPPTTEEANLPPEENMPPPVEEAPKTRSLMNYVDMVFETKKDVPLFQNPGEGPTGVVLPAGTKGKADFEVLIGEDKWYQAKSKKGSGWVNGKNLSIFNLSPANTTPAVTQPVSSQGNIEGSRKESTYFESSSDDVSYYEKPSDKSKKIGQLAPETAYMAVRSEKVNAERWFQLQIRSGETGWARGIDLQLADVQQPVELQTPTKPLSQRGKKSEFQAEWVKASVKGVGVYNRPSITGKMLQQIDPPTIFKVLEMSTANGEWYKIELPGKKDGGWVQTMDVSLTKKE